MNWHTPLCQKILAMKLFPVEQRSALILWASELSGICDVAAPRASVPLVDTRDWRELLLGWSDAHDERELTIYVCPDLKASLHLRHFANLEVTLTPTHEKLKRAVEAFFFEGVHA